MLEPRAIRVTLEQPPIPGARITNCITAGLIKPVNELGTIRGDQTLASLLMYSDGRARKLPVLQERTSLLKLDEAVARDAILVSADFHYGLFIKRELRGEGMTAELIQVAAAHARSKGARILEAYPVLPGSPSYRFMGFVPTFERAGFRRVGPAGSRRHVMRLDLN